MLSMAIQIALNYEPRRAAVGVTQGPLRDAGQRLGLGQRNQAAQGALGIGHGGVDEDAALVLARVDPLGQAGRAVAVLQRDRPDQQVGQGVQRASPGRGPPDRARPAGEPGQGADLAQPLGLGDVGQESGQCGGHALRVAAEGEVIGGLGRHRCGEHFPFGRTQIGLAGWSSGPDSSALRCWATASNTSSLPHWYRAWNWDKVQAKSIDTERSACFFYASLLR